MRAGKAATPARDAHRHASRRRRASPLHAERPGPRRPRHHAAARRRRRMTGTWRAKLHADPEGRSVDAGLVPGRGLRPRAPRSQARAAAGRAVARTETQTIKATGRYLYGPPAADLAIEGDIVVKPSSKDVEGFPGFRSARPTRRSSRCASRSTACHATDADGNAAVADHAAAGHARRPSRSKPTSSCACASPAAARSSAPSPVPST